MASAIADSPIPAPEWVSRRPKSAAGEGLPARWRTVVDRPAGGGIDLAVEQMNLHHGDAGSR